MGAPWETVWKHGQLVEPQHTGTVPPGAAQSGLPSLGPRKVGELAWTAGANMAALHTCTANDCPLTLRTQVIDMA